jgi:pimeloyl-ACP methyl ester carboxylesterase
MGLGGTKEAWVPQIRAFKRYYQVIAFDNRGVGRTGMAEEPFTVENMAEDTLALLDHLGIDSAHILGYSLGGMVAQVIAIDYPERVKKLILVSTVAVGDEPDPSTSGIPKALGLEPSDVEQALKSIDVERLLAAVFDLSFNRWTTRILMRLFARRFAGVVGLEGVTAQLTAAASVNTLDRLDSIRADTLVLTGAADRLVYPSASRVLASRIPHAKLVMIKGGSHAFAIEMRRRFNRAVLDFLNGN